MADKYCRDCGIEFLSELDMGFEDMNIEAVSVFPGHHKKNIVFNPVFICAACKDDLDRSFEEYKKTSEYQLECAFNRFARSFEDDKDFAEVLA